MTSRVLHFRRSPTRPRQAVGFPVRRPPFSLKRREIEGMPILLVSFNAFGALAGITDRPHAFVELSSDVFNHRLIVFHLDMLEQLIGETQLVGEQIHDGVVRFRIEQRFNHLIAPLQRAVRGSDRAKGLKLRGGWQEVNAISTVVHDSCNRWIRIDNHHHVELLHGFTHFRPASLRVHRMPPIEHGANILFLRDLVFVFQHTVNPSRNRNAVAINGF